MEGEGNQMGGIQSEGMILVYTRMWLINCQACSRQCACDTLKGDVYRRELGWCGTGRASVDTALGKTVDIATLVQETQHMEAESTQPPSPSPLILWRQRAHSPPSPLILWRQRAHSPPPPPPLYYSTYTTTNL